MSDLAFFRDRQRERQQREREELVSLRQLHSAQLAGLAVYAKDIADLLMPQDPDWLHLPTTERSLFACPELGDPERRNR